MELATLGLFVQTAGVGLLAVIFLYVSRENRDRVLQTMGYAWLFLFLALLSMVALTGSAVPFENFPFQYLKVLYFVTLIVAADRMSHESPLARPLGIAALAALGLSFAIVFLARSGSVFYAIHMALGALAWSLAGLLVVKSRVRGLGKTLSGLVAFLTASVHVAYVVLFVISALHNDRPLPVLSYIGFYDLFLEMLFGIGLIIWSMEDTERKLESVRARTLDDTQRSRKRAQLDPLTETYNRLFLDEYRPVLSRDPAGGSIVLIDMNGLKSINDREGHEEGDRAIWTVAAAIKKLVRADDFVIRWGGDEFLVVLPGMEEEIARKRFYMLQAKIEEVRQSPRHEDRAYRRFLSASVGVTPYSRRVPFESAVEIADKAMYDRKKAYRETLEPPVPRPSHTPVRPFEKPN